MSNYYNDKLNNFVKNEESIYEYLTGDYMNIYEGDLLNCDRFHIVAEGMKFTKICKYRKFESDAITFENIKQCLSNVISSCHQANNAIAFYVVSYQSEIGIYLASEYKNNIGFDKLNQYIPELESIENSSFPLKETATFSNYGGVVTGNTNLNKNVMDSLIQYMQNNDSVILIVAKPLIKAVENKLQYDIQSLLSKTEYISAIEKSNGNTSNISIPRDFPYNEMLKTYINNYKNRLDNNNNGLWEMCFWFAGNDETFCKYLGAEVAGLFNSNNDGIDKVKYFLTTNNTFKEKAILFPETGNINFNYGLSPYLKKDSLTSILTTNELASLFQLPCDSYNGIQVIDLNVDINSKQSFSGILPDVSRNKFNIGIETQTNQKYSIGIKDINQHVLITGGPGFGKTNTVFNMVLGLQSFNISFCIIESAKKEYWKLIEHINNLQIYSAGYDALPLTINPLEPEDGTIISNHIDDVLHAFSGAFDMEEPTRLALDGLMKYTYEKFGWDLKDVVVHNQKTFPTLKNMFELVDSYIKEKEKSSSDVKQDILGSVVRRLNSLTSGTVGNIMNCNMGIAGTNLCNGSTLIELDDLSDDVKSFIANLLLIKMHQYLRRLDTNSELQNVIVLEEAHNIFSNITIYNEKSSKAIASNHFSSFLSEIRSYGTGIIIIDQGASQLNSNVTANTKIKITHTLSREEDANSIAYALKLNEYQKSRLTDLKTGEAIIGVAGNTGSNKVKINEITLNPISNYACIYCDHKLLCNQRSSNSDIMQLNDARLFISKIYSNRDDPNVIKSIVDGYLDKHDIDEHERFCLLGKILASYNLPCSDLDKRRILYRYIY